MRRMAIYIIVMLVFLTPVNRVDVGNLRPIEVVSLSIENNLYTIRTDMGDIGIGVDVEKALIDLQETSSAVIYLDTARYFLIQTKCQDAALKLRNDLKPNICVCLVEGEIAVDKASKYLDVHGNLPQFRRWTPGDSVPVLTSDKIF